MTKVQVKILKDNYTGRTKIEPGCYYRILVPKDTRGGFKVSLEKEEINELVQRGIVPYDSTAGLEVSFVNFLKSYSVVMDNSTIQLNLKDPYDKLRYQIMINSGIIAESEAKITPKSKGYVYVQEEESKKVLNKIKLKTEAFKIAEKMTLRQKKDVLGIIDKRTRNLEETVITSSLMSFIDQSPDKFLEIWNDPDRDYKAMFKLGLLENKIKKGKGGIYFYGSNALGTDMKTAVSWMKDEKNSIVVMAFIDDLKNAIG